MTDCPICDATGWPDDFHYCPRCGEELHGPPPIREQRSATAGWLVQLRKEDPAAYRKYRAEWWTRRLSRWIARVSRNNAEKQLLKYSEPVLTLAKFAGTYKGKG